MNAARSDETFWDSFVSIPDVIKGQLSEKCFAFPGLVNAHDHLEFNLFPALANRVYSDYREWGQDIHVQQRDIIRRIERIPIGERMRFGVLKNLVNGFTRVVHHGPHAAMISELTDYPVWTHYHYVDALGTDPYWKIKLNLPFTGELMVHVGEGTSETAQREIDRLIRWNLTHKALNGIHAISLTPEQARHFHSVVWCPDSNLLLYKKTLEVDKIKDWVTVLFGTDSTVSSRANAWDHFRLVRNLGIISDAAFFRMLCDSAFTHLYGLRQPGDWVLARRKKSSRWDSFFELNPEDILLVTIRGAVWLCDDTLPASLRPQHPTGIQIGNTLKWVEQGLGSVVKTLKKYDVELPLNIQHHE